MKPSLTANTAPELPSAQDFPARDSVLDGIHSLRWTSGEAMRSDRWEVLAGDNPSTTLTLDDLLAAQVQLMVSENALVRSRINENPALVSLTDV